jgi:hypothetical protein
MNAPTGAIVKWQPLYALPHNDGRAARLRRICGKLPTVLLFSYSVFSNGLLSLERALSSDLSRTQIWLTAPPASRPALRL